MKTRHALRARTIRNTTAALLEALEPRTLLSAAPFAKGKKPGGTNFDLTPTAIGIPNLKAALVAGFADTGSVAVTVRNLGTDTSGAATVSLFLETTNGSVEYAVTKTPGKIKKVAGGTTATANVKLALPATLAAGTYQFIAVVNGTDTNSADNTVTLPGTFTVNAGSSALGASITSDKIPLTLDASSTKPGSVSVAFKNTGNSPSPAASVTVNLVLHPATGSNVTLIIAQTFSIPTLKPGASAKPVTITLPSLAAVPAGTYTPILTLTPAGFSNNTPVVITSPIPVTITSGTVVTPPTTGLLLHGDILHMDANTQLTGGNFEELGNFTISGSKITGSYTYTPGTLKLTYSDGSSELIDVLPIDTSATSVTFMDPILDGNPTTVTFNTNPTGAFAQSFGLGATNTTTAYLHH